MRGIRRRISSEKSLAFRVPGVIKSSKGKGGNTLPLKEFSHGECEGTTIGFKQINKVHKKKYTSDATKGKKKKRLGSKKKKEKDDYQ